MSHPSELISAYLDGALNRGEVGALIDHLSNCGRCTEELEAMQRVRSAVRSLPMVELPPGLVPETDPVVVPLRRNRGLLVGVAAAAVAVVIAVAALVTPPTQPISVEDLSSRFGARVSLDPAFGPGKMAVPALVETQR